VRFRVRRSAEHVAAGAQARAHDGALPGPRARVPGRGGGRPRGRAPRGRPVRQPGRAPVRHHPAHQPAGGACGGLQGAPACLSQGLAAAAGAGSKDNCSGQRPACFPTPSAVCSACRCGELWRPAGGHATHMATGARCPCRGREARRRPCAGRLCAAGPCAGRGAARARAHPVRRRVWRGGGRRGRRRPVQGLPGAPGATLYHIPYTRCGPNASQRLRRRRPRPLLGVLYGLRSPAPRLRPQTRSSVWRCLHAGGNRRAPGQG